MLSYLLRPVVKYISLPNTCMENSVSKFPPFLIATAPFLDLMSGWHPVFLAGEILKLIKCAAKAGQGLLSALLWPGSASLILSAVDQLLCSQNKRKLKIYHNYHLCNTQPHRLQKSFLNFFGIKGMLANPKVPTNRYRQNTSCMS